MKKYNLFMMFFLVFFILFFPGSAGWKIAIIAFIFLLPYLVKQLLKKGGGKNTLVEMFFSLFIFLFVVSCATTQQQVVMPTPTEGTTKVRFTKIGVDEKQAPPLSFFLVPETLNVEVPYEKDTPLFVNFVNCKEEVLMVSVNPQTIPEWIRIHPAFLVRALEIKRVDFTLMPYKSKDVPQEFSITFKAKESVRNLKLTVKVSKSEKVDSLGKQEVQPVPPKEVEKKPIEVPKVKDVVRRVLFSVHVASFKNREEALDFVDSMPNLEPKTSVILYDLGSKGLWYRVFVGLYNTHETALGVARHFKEFFGWGYALPIQVYEDSFLRGKVKKRKRE
ncbi:MAG: SPOR domain-containing protein [archaeon]